MGPQWVARHLIRWTNYLLQQILHSYPTFCMFYIFLCRSPAKIMVQRWRESTSSTWFFFLPSQRAFFQRLFDFQTLYFSFWASALIYAIRFPRLLWLCTWTVSLHVYPPSVTFSSVNPACASSSVLSQHVLSFLHNDSSFFFFHISVYFWLHSVLVIQPAWKHLPFHWSQCVSWKCP